MKLLQVGTLWPPFESVDWWVGPTNCAITADVTMSSNTISGDVTITEATNTWDVTMPVNSVTDDVGIGCGHQ
jgi:hypothetical protein